MSTARPIPTTDLLKLALDLGIPIYENQLHNLFDEVDVKNALNVAYSKIPPTLLRSEIESRDSELNKILALLYNFNTVLEIAKFEKIKLRNEIVRVKKIQDLFQEYLTEKHLQAFIKKFWDSIEDDYQEQQLKLLLDQKFPEMKKHYQIFMEIVSVEKELKELTSQFNDSAHRLNQVLEMRVEETIKIFEQDRERFLNEIEDECEVLGDQMLSEYREFMKIQQLLHNLETSDEHHGSSQTQELQDKMQHKANKIKQHQQVIKLNTDYVREQIQIASDQKIIRQNSRRVLREITDDPTQLDKGVIATKSILIIAVQHMRALKDKDDHQDEKETILGNNQNKPPTTKDNVLQPQKLTKQLNAELDKVITLGQKEEKEEKKVIKGLHAQCDKVSMKINQLKNELDALEGKKLIMSKGKVRFDEPTNKKNQ